MAETEKDINELQITGEDIDKRTLLRDKINNLEGFQRKRLLQIIK